MDIKFTVGVPEQLYPLMDFRLESIRHNLSKQLQYWNGMHLLHLLTISFLKFQVMSTRDVITTTIQQDILPIQLLRFWNDKSAEKGNLYHWRMINYDYDSRFGTYSESSFLVSSLTSNWLVG